MVYNFNNEDNDKKNLVYHKNMWLHELETWYACLLWCKHLNYIHVYQVYKIIGMVSCDQIVVLFLTVTSRSETK